MVIALGCAGPAGAQVYDVNSTLDSGGTCPGNPCTLRDAAVAARGTPEADTLRLAPGDYVLTSAPLPDMNTGGDLTIEGTGGAAVTKITSGADSTNAGFTGGLVAVQSPQSLTVRGVTIHDAFVSGGGGTIVAGAIVFNSSGQLTIDHSVLRGNRSIAATTSTGRGVGAIYQAFGSLTITDSAIEDNVWAGNDAVLAGGGVVAEAASSVTIARSSISRNRVDPAVGTNIEVAGGASLSATGPITIADSTVSGNSVSARATGPRVGGVTLNSSMASLTRSTLFGNAAAGTGGTVVGNLNWVSQKEVGNTIVAGGSPSNCAGAGTSIGGNIEDANTCNFTRTDDLRNTNPMLEALGPDIVSLGLVHRLRAGSPAFNRAVGACSGTDQVGGARPQGAGCDSGAYEGVTTPANTAAPSIAGAPGDGQTLTCNPGSYADAATFAFQWLSDSTPIAGATGQTFTVTGAQLDTAVQCRVTATNAAGTVVSTTAAVVPPSPAPVPQVVVQQVVVPAPAPVTPPVNTARPRFSGTLRTGQKLTCSPGTFTGATSFATAWLRNGTRAGSGSSYTLGNADAGKAIQCQVTATGAGGSTVAESAPGVSAKACIVPKLVGRTVSKARKALSKAGCKLGKTRTRKSGKKAGTVIASSPAKGKNVAAGPRSRSPSRSGSSASTCQTSRAPPSLGCGGRTTSPKGERGRRAVLDRAPQHPRRVGRSGAAFGGR